MANALYTESFEYGLGGWNTSWSNATASLSAEQAAHGRTSLKIVAAAPGTIFNGLSPYIEGIVPGTRYTFGMSFLNMLQPGTSVLRMFISWFKSDNTASAYKAQEVSPVYYPSTMGQWSDVGFFSEPAPPDAAKARLTFWINQSQVAGTAFYMDKVSLVETNLDIFKVPNVNILPFSEIDIFSTSHASFNLISAANSGFETGNGWSASLLNATVSASTDMFLDGTKSMKIVKTAGGGTYVYSGIGTSGAPCLPNTWYSANCFMRLAPGTPSTLVNFYIQYYSSTGTLLSSPSVSATITDAAWTPLFVQAKSDATAAYANLVIRNDAAAAGAIMYADRAQLSALNQFTASQGTLSVQASLAGVSPYALRLTCTVNGFASVTRGTINEFAVIPGQKYTFKFTANTGSTGAKQYAAQINWRDAAGALVSFDAPAASVNPGVAVALATTAQAPATAAYAQLVVRMNNPVIGDWIEFDQMSFSLGENVTEVTQFRRDWLYYFPDGTTLLDTPVPAAMGVLSVETANGRLFTAPGLGSSYDLTRLVAVYNYMTDEAKTNLKTTFGKNMAPPGVAGDDFDRPNTTADLISTPSGHVWNKLGVGVAGISSKSAYYASGAGQAIYTVASGISDGRVAIVLATKGTEAFVVFRSSDVNNMWRYGYSSGSGLKLEKRVAGTWTPVSNVSNVPVSGNKLVVVLLGDSIFCYLNEKVMLSTSDSFNATATNHGIWLGQATGDTIDKFYVLSV